MERGTLGNVAWMAAGAAALLGLLFAIGYLRPTGWSEEDVTANAAKQRLVARMRLDLAREAEAEKSAVLADTDKQSVEFAEQAKTALTEIERIRAELKKLLAGQGGAKEIALFEEFSRGFAELARVDEELLGLAVQNTNLKAQSLAFGPAAQAYDDMEAGLSALLKAMAGTPEACPAALAAAAATNAALGVRVIIAPHIAEISDEKMDALEAAMAAKQQEAAGALAVLSGLAPAEEKETLEKIRQNFQRFEEIVRDIIKLSRANTNVLSLVISLNQKRKVYALCQETLAALQEILPDPLPAAGKFGRRN